MFSISQFLNCSYFSRQKRFFSRFFLITNLASYSNVQLLDQKMLTFCEILNCISKFGDVSHFFKSFFFKILLSWRNINMYINCWSFGVSVKILLISQNYRCEEQEHIHLTCHPALKSEGGGGAWQLSLLAPLVPTPMLINEWITNCIIMGILYQK